MVTQTSSRFDVTPLAASDRPKRYYSYYVTGRGAFPFDMLRFDSAWPTSPEDAGRINAEYRAKDSRRSVRLSSFTEPTVDRWLSFGWTVGITKLY